MYHFPVNDASLCFFLHLSAAQRSSLLWSTEHFLWISPRWRWIPAGLDLWTIWYRLPLRHALQLSGGEWLPTVSIPLTMPFHTIARTVLVTLSHAPTGTIYFRCFSPKCWVMLSRAPTRIIDHIVRMCHDDRSTSEFSGSMRFGSIFLHSSGQSSNCEMTPATRTEIDTMSRDDGSCCSTWALVSGDVESALCQCFCLWIESSLAARRLCHTSSDEGADGFRTHRSIMRKDWTEVFHSVKMMLHKSHNGKLWRGQESYWYKEVRPKV